MLRLIKDFGGWHHRKGLHRGCTYFRWIDPKDIVVSQWVRMKCMYGCDCYGATGCCPPEAPSVVECERFFREYSRAVIFHFHKRVRRPEDRHAWTRRVNAGLLKLEREVFLAGNERAFLLFMDTCGRCKECAGSRRDCVDKMGARPTADALAVDVYTTVRKAGYHIEVLKDYRQPMDRYAFLMVR
jgi:predicted metal-binding protein